MSKHLKWQKMDRKVTITGSQRAIQQAETMIKQKVDSASERETE